VPAIDLKLLVGRLGEVCRKTLETAAGSTLSRTNFNVELEHWLLQLLDQPRSDIVLAVRAFEIVPAQLTTQLSAAVDRMKTGNGRAPALSPELVDVVKDGWLFASVERGEGTLRSGHMLWAMLSSDSVAQRLAAVAPLLRRISPDTLKRDFDVMLADSAELPPPGLESDPDLAPVAPAAGPDAVDRFTIDLTAQARAGKIDPILGRDDEIRQMVDILTRRRQNNPILTGEAGVGKTAVVEGLALRIAIGDVPAPLAPVSIRTLDLGLLQAGAGVKGEFENRLRAVIDGVRASPAPVILFVDEAHMLIGAGGANGQGDAANLLKPALARGELRVIAATTWAEYKKFFEKDAALTRRFQTVKVEEPSEPVAIDMVRGLLPSLESHHKVRVLDEAVAASVRLSARFIPSRQLPDKAVSLIDTACARVAMSQAATPPAIEARHRRIAAVDAELGVLQREALSGADHAARVMELDTERTTRVDELAVLEGRWDEERELVAQIRNLRAELEDARPGVGSRDALEAATADLAALQREQPMVFPVVNAQAVAEIVENWTGIPAGRMRSDEIRTVLDLREALGRRVVGQDHALEAVARAVQTSRAGLTDQRKPIGVFLMVGTSGVGKTETALALAELLYGGEQNLTTINMTEFKEEHKVSLLMGSPPGYVGYGEGGILTEAVRRRPYSVVLLDEVEKAHPDVHEIFFQVFDKGWMEDGEGRMIDFKNTIILLTTNAGSELVMSMCRDPELLPDSNALADALKAPLMKVFPPALLGRIVTIPYYPLSPDMMKKIVRLQLGRIKKRVETNHGVPFEYSDAVVDQVVARCQDPESGGRVIDAILTNTVLPTISVEYLQRLASGGEIRRVALDVKDADFTYAFD
jgi:type VI secretion system protein VasG